LAPGQPLDWKHWVQLGAAEKAKLALPFTHFLARLHAEIPADEASALGVTVRYHWYRLSGGSTMASVARLKWENCSRRINEDLRG
jgi:hypothetical protein